MQTNLARAHGFSQQAHNFHDCWTGKIKILYFSMELFE